MTETEWLRVGAEAGTTQEVDCLVDELSRDGRRFTRAQLLRFGLAFGLTAIKRDPSVLIPGSKRPVKG